MRSNHHRFLRVVFFLALQQCNMCGVTGNTIFSSLLATKLSRNHPIMQMRQEISCFLRIIIDHSNSMFRKLKKTIPK